MKMNFKFVKYEKLSYFISALLVLGTIWALATKGLNYGIDFSGGVLMDVKSKTSTYNIGHMRSDLSKFNPELQEDDKGQVLIRVGLAKGSTDSEQNKMVATIKSILGDKVSYQQVQVVGPKIGNELIRGGILAIVFAFLMMSIYIWSRYKSGYAAGVLISIFLDAFLMFGFFSITGLEFSLTAVAVILTGVGYSINDKVVNYDRIEENSRKYRSMEVSDIIDLSVNEVLSRTIKTSLSVILGMVSLYLFAGAVLQEFALAMMFCVVLGTLTSIYVSNACLIHFKIRDDN